MFKMKALAVALSTAMLASGSANAATIILSSFSASWTGTTGGSNIDIDNGDPARLEWGRGGTSSFTHDSSNNNRTFNITTGTTPSQSIGTFRHVNDDINAGTSITSSVLNLRMFVSIDGVSFGPQTFSFNVGHNETTNTGMFCCSDVVTFSPLNTSKVFSAGGIDYTLNLAGFGTSASNIQSSFSTPENGSNSRNLYAYVSAATAPVPEPATWAMMIGGLGLVGMTMRRRKTTVSFA
jgi:hypothetical protein